jgi:hypothetical protein
MSIKVEIMTNNELLELEKRLYKMIEDAVYEKIRNGVVINGVLYKTIAPIKEFEVGEEVSYDKPLGGTANYIAKAYIKEYGDYIQLATCPTLYGSFKAELYDSEYNNLLTRTLKFRTNDYHYDKNTETFSFSDSVRFWFA